MSEPHHINVRRSLLNPHPRDDRHARHAAHASRHRHVATEAHATDRKKRQRRAATKATTPPATNTDTRRRQPHTQTRKPPQPHQPGTATGASRHRIRNQRHHTRQPRPTRGACSLAARNALITAQPQVKGNHHGHTPTVARPPRRRGEPPEHGRDKEKIRVPARVSQARREHPADNTRDSSGQQRNRTSPEQFERTD